MSSLNDILKSIIYIIITSILPILVRYIIKLINAKIDELTANIENEKAKRYIDVIVDAISIAVTSVNQTYVDSLKFAGTFDEESASIAKKLAIQKAKDLITADSKQFIEMAYGDFDKYLEDAIESYVRQEKLS